MPFNEQNTAKHLISHRIIWLNLNEVQGKLVNSDAAEYDSVKWKYVKHIQAIWQHYCTKMFNY